MELNLQGKAALVTGGSRGIGAAIVKTLKEEGVTTSWVSRSVGIDLSTKEGLDKTVSLLRQTKTEILIHNCGGVGSDPNEWELALEKNYKVVVKLTEEFLKMKKTWGRIITIGSIYGKEKGPNPGFAAAKSAQIAYIKSLAGRYDGVTFNCVVPGHIDVGKPFPDNPKVVGMPEDVAYVVAFLCSDLAKHINGALITVDGGESHSF